MKILFTETNFDPETPYKLLNAGHEVFIPKKEIEGVHEFDRSALIQTIKDLKPDILVCGLRFMIDKEILDSAPIKAIFTRTTGLDHIDLDYCKKRESEVLSLRGEDLSDITATAEWTFIQMGVLLRKTGHELNGKTLGIIGHGRLGKMMIEYGTAFGMKCISIDKEGVRDSKYLLKEMLEQCDVVSLHITADPENRNFMDREKFAQMKQGSWFLNSSRDWLVDKLALQEALEGGKLAGAWSDFPEHQGGKTLESSIKTEKVIVNKLLQWLSK